MKLHIEKLGINGEGIARGEEHICKDKVCFVSGALPNEIVDVEVVKNKSSYCNCELNKLIKTSEHRVEPECQYFNKCGGCDIQHMDKFLQNDFKLNKVKETLKKFAKVNFDVSQVVRLNDFGYRNKMVFPIVNVKNKPIIGMFAKNSHSIVDINNCKICRDIINDILNISKVYFSSSNFTGFDFKTKKGDIKYIVIRVVNDNILITIVATRKVELNEYYNILNASFKNVGLSIIINDSESEILSGKYIHLFGLERLSIKEFGIKYEIDNRGFLQVNDDVKEKLYSYVLDEISQEDNVVDAYSGAGLLSAIISKKCNFVTGIEINESASNSAKNLAKLNKITNIKFITGDVKDNISHAFSDKNNIVILDPPRSGCDKAILEEINNQKESINKIIYISCDPATLSRDVSILKENYIVTKVIPFDMFPQTKHVETLVVLERKVKKKFL